MLSLLLSLLLALAQVVLCPGLQCQFLAADQAVPGSRAVPQATHGAPSLDDALAMMGQAAIEAAFSGVVRVGDGPVASASSHSRDC